MANLSLVARGQALMRLQVLCLDPKEKAEPQRCMQPPLWASAVTPHPTPVLLYMSTAGRQKVCLPRAGLATAPAWGHSWDTLEPGLELRTQPGDASVWWGAPGTSGQRPPEACATKSAGPDAAVCPGKRVADLRPTGEGKEALVGRRGCGSRGVRTQPPPSFKEEILSSDVNRPARSWKCSDDLCGSDRTHLARAWAARVRAKSRDLSLPCCVQLINRSSGDLR